MNTQTKEITMKALAFAAVAADRFKTQVLPDLHIRAMELQTDAEALKDALVIRFSKDPVVIHRCSSRWHEASLDAHTTLSPEDAASDHRRSNWVQSAENSRYDALAKRWGFSAVDIGLCPEPTFVAPVSDFDMPLEHENEASEEYQSSWRAFDHIEAEEEYQARVHKQTANIRRHAKSLAVGLGSFAGLGVVVTGIVAMVYLGGWLGTIAALYALGAILEVVA